MSPLASIAQQPGRVWRVGFLAGGAGFYAADFQRAMYQLGYIEGKNLVLEWRFADGKIDRLPALAADLVESRVDIIVTDSTQSTRAAQRATATVPIVMATVGDPVASGFAKTLARPGGNITGFSLGTTDVSVKWLQYAKIIDPQKLVQVGVVSHPGSLTKATHIANIQAAAQKMRARLLHVDVSNEDEFDRAFALMVKSGVSTVIMLPDIAFVQLRLPAALLALKHHLRLIATSRVFAEAGALISYGQDYADYFRRTPIYVDKILKGAKPADLPIEQPNIFELIVNRKTAKALGLTIPNELLLRADMVIE